MSNLQEAMPSDLVNVPQGLTTVDGVRLSGLMVSVLIGHASCERPVKVSEGETLRALKARGLIRFNRLNKPSHTIATSRGREIISALLSGTR